MGLIARGLAVFAILAAGALPLAAFDGPTQTTAPKKKATAGDKPAAEEKNSAESDKQKTAALAQRGLEAGIKAYEAGKADQAIRAFETALHAGLDSQQVARALYYRGLANRKLGKPGLAISDLTSAVWLKNGLSETERQDALKHRIAAYQEAGISDAPEATQSALAVDTSSLTGWDTAMTGQPPAPSQSAAAPPPASTAAAPPPDSAAVAALPAPEPAQAPPQPAPQPKSSGGISGFFSNIFGGGSSSSSTPNANDGSMTTASIASSPPAQAASWSQTTQVSAAEPVTSQFVTKVATSGKPDRAEKGAAARAPSGKFRLQVAAVRSRSEADALAASLVQQHGAQLGARQPEVDEAVIGSMGTFYRVRLGPYADAKEPQQLCGSLRTSGFDCLVVTK
jgi:tetratricopeptide (TPR) repeat protein